MKKRIVSIILSLVMLLSLLPVTAFADTVTGLSGSGTAADPYLIGTLDELEYMAQQVNAPNEKIVSGSNHPLASEAYYRLTADIGNTTGFSPIGTSTNKFSGTFDGGGHTVTLSISTTGAYAGLFGYVSGTVKNVITAGSVSSTNTSGEVGGVCGSNNGTIVNCGNTAAVTGKSGNTGGVCGSIAGTGTVANSYNTGTVKTGANVGGVCGSNSGTILNCGNTGSVSGTSNVGGVCGYIAASGTILNCGNTAAVESTSTSTDSHVGGVCGYIAGTGTVANSYNTGSVTGEASNAGPSIGGVCGYIANNGELTNCYNNVKMAAYYTRGSVCGKNLGTMTSCYGAGNDSDMYGEYSKGTTKEVKKVPMMTFQLRDNLNNYITGNSSTTEGWLKWYDAGIYVALPCHVNVVSSANGTVAITNVNRSPYNVEDYFAAGETVMLKVTPDEGYVLKEGGLKVNGVATDIKEGTNAGEYTFTMPACPATVTAEFGLPPHTHTVGNEVVEFKPWIPSEHGGALLPNEAGSWYLDTDVTLNNTWTVPDGTTNLCLNGYVIKLTPTSGTPSVIEVGSSADLRLFDCGTETENAGYLDFFGEWHPGTDAQGTTTTKNITGGVITGGDAGGGVNVSGIFTMYGGTIIGNTSDINHGGVTVNASALFTMNGGTISYNKYDNTAGNGGVYVTGNGASFVMNDGTISNNVSNWFGGGVYVNGSGASFVMKKGTISDNEANYSDSTTGKGAGGGVCVDAGASFTMKKGTISENTVNSSTNGGGGVAVNGSGTSFLMEDGTISGNMAVHGGGVWVSGSSSGGSATFTMKKGTISGNTANSTSAGHGGGVYLDATRGNATFTMEDGTIEHNTATGTSTGGGVYVYGSTVGTATFTMKKGTIRNNEAVGGGGVCLVNANGAQNAFFTMEDGTISANEANNGGGVYVGSGTFTMKDGVFSGNKATSGNGGGVYVTTAKFNMSGGTITGNTSASKGGGVYHAGTTVLGGTARITGNTANSAVSNLTVSSGTIDIGTGSNISAPKNGMLVGVNRGNVGQFTNNGSSGHEKYFTSDAENRFVEYNSSHLELATISYQKVIKTEVTGNGVVYASPQMSEFGGDTITVEAIPDEGWELESLKYNDGSDHDLTENTFTMPNTPPGKLIVTVKATFVKSGPKIKVEKAKDQGGNEVANPVYNTAYNGTLFEVTTLNFPEGTPPTLTLQWQKVNGQAVTWNGTAPTGVTLNKDTGAVTTTNQTPAGSYVFRITNSVDEFIEEEPNPDFVCGEGTLTVDKATPTITTAPTASAIVYGKAVSASQLTGGVATPSGGTFAWESTDAALTPTVAQSGTAYTVVYTPTDTNNYNTATVEVAVTVNKYTPSITAWPTLPATITYGDFATFGDITLTGGTEKESIAGTFGWADSFKNTEATVANGGTKTDPFVFTPTDTDNYNTVTGGGSVAVTINAANYADTYSREASGNLKAKLDETVEITLPEIPTGASYDTPVNTTNAELFSVGTITDKKLTVTSLRDWVKGTDGEAAKTFTVPVTPDANHNSYNITVSITPVYKTEVSFAEDATPINGGAPITFSDSGANYTVTAPTVSVGGTPLAQQPEMTYTYYKNTGTDDAPAWTVLDPATEKPANVGSYKVVIAVPDSNETYAGSKEYTFTIVKATPAAPALADAASIDYTNETIAPQGGYEISTTSGDDFATGKLTGETAIDFTKTYYVRKVEDANHNASAQETFVPARPTTPGTPELVSKTDTTVVVTAVTGQEYSIDNGANWVAGTNGKVTFSGLTQNTAYSVITRVKAVTTSGSESFASANSEALSVTTKTSPAVAPIGVTASVTATSVILPPSGKPNTYEYSANGTNWQDSNAFTGLDPATQYTYYVRVKETDTAMPSQAATVTAYTNQSAPKKGDGYKIDSYNAQGQPIISITSGYQVSTSPDFTSTISTNTALTVGETYYVRKAASGSIGASAGTAFVATEQPKVTVSAVNSNSKGGSVKVEGVTNGVCFVGTSVTLTATPNAGYKFVGWYDGETQKSTANPYTFNANDATILTAKFVVDKDKVETAPVSTARVYNKSATTLGTLKGTHHYSLTSDPASIQNAGTYKLTAKLEDGYVWEDGTTADKTFFYTVTKQVTSALPENVSANTSGNGITGVTDAMEWRKSTDSAYRTGTGNDLTNLDYGTYYIRVKGDANREAGKDVVIVLRSPVTTKAPTDITATTATLNGASGDTVTYQYRKAGSEDKWLTSNGNLTGLSPDTEYEFCAIIGEGGDQVAGEVMTFRTEKQNPPTGSIQVHIKGTGSTDVTVAVEQGNTIISTKTGSIASGTMNASFTNLADGYYNLVVSTNDYTETRLLEVKNGAATQAKFDIPTGTLNSVVEVKKDAPKVAVGGLADVITEADANAAAAGSKSVEVKLEVEKTPEANIEGGDQIKVLAGNQVVDTFLDMSLFKTTTEINGDNKTTTRENIGSEESNPVLEIVIPFNTNRNGLQIYHYHNGVAKKLAKLSERPTGSFTDGTYYIGDGYLFVYSKQFSTYAIGYEQESSGGGSSSYAIGLPTNVKNGKVEVSPKNASAGQTVTLTVTPDKGFTLETLTVLDKNGKEVEVKNLGNSKFSFKMPGGKVSISATFMEDNSMLNFFVDVKAASYYYDAVLWAAENDITKGTDAVHFSPNAPVTRAQVVTFLWRAAGKPVVNYAMSFADVSGDAYYTEAVRWAVAEGITKGTSDTTFSPDKVCTRGQIVTFLARFAGVEDDASGYSHGFTDVKATDYYNNAVAWAKDNKVTEGTSATTFSPNTDCTRAQVVTFLYRWMVK